MRNTTPEEYKRLVEEQCQALMSAIQSVALGDLDVEVEIPEGIEPLSDLAVGIQVMIDDLQAMMTEQVRTQLVEKQSRALLDVVQSVALGDLDVQTQIPEGLEVLSELGVGIEMMIDDIREMLAQQEKARAEVEEARQQLEAALEEVLAVQKRYLQQTWEDYATSKASLGYFRSASEGDSTTDDWLPGMTAAVEKMSTVVQHDKEGEILSTPIHLYGEAIGTLGLSREEGVPWSADDIAMVEDIVAQVALALENQRLFDEAQHASQLLGQRVEELNVLNEIGHRIDETPPVTEFLQWVTERAPSAMQYPDICVVAIEFEGQVYGQPEAIDLPYQIVQGLRIGGESLGKVHIAYTEQRDFLNTESALLGDIVRRVSGYIENRRLFGQAEDRARQERVLREITARVRAATDSDTIVRAAVRELGTTLGRPTFIRLGSAEDLRSLATQAGGEHGNTAPREGGE